MIKRRMVLRVALVAFALAAAWCAVSWIRADRPSATSPLPGHSRYGFVLDGQSPDGNRVAAGLDLLRSGRVDTLIVSGVALSKDVYYSMIWVRQAPLDSATRGRVLEMRSFCSSTLDEARMMDLFFRERGVDTAVVVTSDYHVWRAASIFDKVSQGRIAWFFHGASDSRWNGRAGSREGIKARFMEWTKRLVWALFERWKPLDAAPPKFNRLVGGEELGRLPPPAWKE